MKRRRDPILSVHVNQAETAEIRARMKERESGEGSLVGVFGEDFNLYRAMDGEELARVVRTGKIIGGMYAVKAERAYGASWGTSWPEVVSWANRERGHRLGGDLFLAQIRAKGKKFYHMDPKVAFDRNGEATVEMDMARCNTGLGCSVVGVTFAEATFRPIGLTGSVGDLMSHEAVKAYAGSRKIKHVELRPIAPGLYITGSIHGTDVAVRREQGEGPYRNTWTVTTRDEEPIVKGAASEKIAVTRATKALRYRHSSQEVIDLLPKYKREEWRKIQAFREKSYTWRNL